MIQQDSIIIKGTVQHGLGQGRQLGWPTANLTYEAVIPPPAPGVYAGWVDTQEKRYRAAIIVGARPQNPPLVEAHILEFEGDLVGALITCTLVKFISALEELKNNEALKNKISRDIEAVKNCVMN